MMHHAFAAPKESITATAFLIGLVTLFAVNWLWPGILVLVGVTVLLELALRRWLADPEEIPLRVENPEGDRENE
ncbi:MAG: hypothetical protein KF893_13025 [Caldilineaceae bacterium]|nr:hypothetical protein [Caldilineaceae bacterium]